MHARALTRREALAFAAAGTLALTGCGEGSSAGAEPVDESAPAVSPSTITPVDPSGWDAQYYVPAHATGAEARAAAEEVARRVEAEGIVLLKNDDAALPLPAGTRVSLLGRSAAGTIFGGTGAAGIATEACIGLADGIAQAGLDVNTAPSEWISTVLDSYPRGAVGQLDRPSTVTHYIGEIPWEDYPEDVRSGVEGTVGIVVLGRPGAEGDDLSIDLLGDLADPEVETFTPNRETEGYIEGQHQLEHTREELSLIAGAKASCSQLIVLLNVATTMEVGPLVEKGGAYEADAIVEIGFPGGVGALAVGDVLAGVVNPSGRTTDTWATDLTATPSFANFAARRYTDISDHYTQLGSNVYFVEYAEGIYVGYRWFETADAEGAIDYGADVTFPFGFGLSYTTFEQTLDGVGFSQDGTVEATVTVTNTGSVPGKDVVQLYHSAPWSPAGTEVSAVVLAAFAKTRELAPGESQELALSWSLRDVASYDPKIHGWYREAGTNTVSLRANSHDVVDSWDEYLEELAYLEDDVTGSKIENRFEDLDEYLRGNVTLLSRKDIRGTFPPNVCRQDRRGSRCRDRDVRPARPHRLLGRDALARAEERPHARRPAWPRPRRPRLGPARRPAAAGPDGEARGRQRLRKRRDRHRGQAQDRRARRTRGFCIRLHDRGQGPCCLPERLRAGADLERRAHARDGRRARRGGAPWRPSRRRAGAPRLAQPRQ